MVQRIHTTINDVNQKKDSVRSDKSFFRIIWRSHQATMNKDKYDIFLRFYQEFKMIYCLSVRNCDLYYLAVSGDHQFV